jgi:lipopolysaccharide transport system ATP-binding protein
MADEPLIRVEGVSKKYCANLARALRYGAQDILSELTMRREAVAGGLRPGEFWALDDVSFELHPGESVGVIGRNGAGKSTLLRLLAGVTKPDRGRITVRGRVGALLSLGAGFDPVLTGRENIAIEGTALGLSRRQLRGMVDEIVDFAELGDFIDAPVHTYSSGMRMRLGFAVATSLQTDVLLLDEVLVVGDINFRRKSVQHIKHFIQEGGAVVFVSHEVWLIQAICTSAIHLTHGALTHEGDVLATINHYFAELEAAAAGTASDAGTRIVPVDHEDVDEGEGEAGDLDEPRPGGVVPAASPIRFEDVSIRSLDHDEIVMGDRVEVAVTFESSLAYDAVFWGFLMWTADRMVCITAQGTDFDLPAFSIPVGRSEVRGTIDHMPHMRGLFVLGVAIVDDVTRMPVALFGWDDQGLLFTVHTPDDPKTAVLKTAGPMLDMPVTWDATTPRILDDHSEVS